MDEVKNPLAECPDSPNCARKSVSFASDSTLVSEAILSALKAMKAHEINKQEDKKRIDAVFRIPVFGWLDDVHIVLESVSDSTYVHLRSASREGYYDIGVNKRRLRKLLRHTQKNLTD